MIRVQHAEKKHALEVVECLSALDFGDRSFLDEDMVLRIIEEASLFVAVEVVDSLGEQVVGAMILQYENFSYEIHSLACRDSHRGKGIGSALVQMAVKKCQAERVPKLWCWSMDRYKAKSFYEKQGFQEFYCLRQQCFGEDCWLFGKCIDLPDSAS